MGSRFVLKLFSTCSLVNSGSNPCPIISLVNSSAEKVVSPSTCRAEEAVTSILAVPAVSNATLVLSGWGCGKMRMALLGSSVSCTFTATSPFSARYFPWKNGRVSPTAPLTVAGGFWRTVMVLALVVGWGSGMGSSSLLHATKLSPAAMPKPCLGWCLPERLCFGLRFLCRLLPIVIFRGDFVFAVSFDKGKKCTVMVAE